VLHHIRVYTNNLHICAADRLTLVSSYSFDAAVMDIFGALLNGATLYPINIKEERVEDIVQWCREQALTIYHSTPTVYRYVVGALPAGTSFPALRLLVLGGEEVSRRDVELYHQHFAPSCLLVNGLGPTESTVTLQYFLDQHTALPRHTVPVGCPVEETEILLLDSTGAPTAVVGEIAICSPYVALGYWRQPEFTQSRFLPVAGQEHKRLYRTGDLGRFRLDGTLEFVGRTDHQVKIRGLRIELGEIETVLGHHPAVRDTVVLAREDALGEKRLIAYVVPQPPGDLDLEQLRTFLVQRLPAYMLPTAFVTLDTLPHTPNGKLDRRALPAPPPHRPHDETALVAPRTPIEMALAQIWAELLGVERVGIDENFFALGGHSLLAIRVMARIRDAFQIDLPLPAIFEAPTIAAMAVAIVQQQAVQARPDVLADLLAQVEELSEAEVQRCWTLT
jgi:acyl-coenzyme A synthetase/AMP-(fatty) acid ligase/acyl carrier protein